MKENNIYKLLIISVLCLICNVGFSQDDCTLTLAKAQRLFDAGNIEQIPAMLKPCMEKGFNAEEKQQAQKLIVLSYLFDKNTTEAEKGMFEFLKKYPEYALSTSDQAEFVQLFDTYRTLPIASLGFCLGGNYSQMTLVKIYDPADAIGEYTSPTPGFQAGLSFRVYLVDKFDLNLEANYLQASYQYYNGKLAGGNTVTLNETQANIAIPLSIIYTPVSFKKFSPFIRAGLSVNYMLSSTMQSQRQTLASAKPITIPDFSMLESRNPLQIQLVGAVGFTYNLKQSYVMFDVRYNRGLMLQTTNKKGLDAVNQDVWSVNQIVENDFVMNNFAVTIGLFYKFYKPRKR